MPVISPEFTQEIEEFLFYMGIKTCITPEDVGMWTQSYILYYYYLNWKLTEYPNDEECLSTDQFVRNFPKCKTMRTPNGYTDFKVNRGDKMIINTDIRKKAKHLYVQEIVWQENQKRNRKTGKRLVQSRKKSAKKEKKNNTPA